MPRGCELERTNNVQNLHVNGVKKPVPFYTQQTNSRNTISLVPQRQPHPLSPRRHQAPCR